MISRVWSHFVGCKKCKTHISDGFLRPTTVILTLEVSSMCGEYLCERILKNKNFFHPKTFFKFVGTTQKFIKNRHPQMLKKVIKSIKINDFAVLEPFCRLKKMQNSHFGRFASSYGRNFDTGN